MPLSTPKPNYIYIYIYIYIYMGGHSINERNFFNKKQNKSFFRFFPHKSKLNIVWNWFTAKIILEASPEKTAALRPPTSDLTHHPSKKVGPCWGRKNELISDVLLWNLTHGHTSVNQLAKTYIHRLCADTGCRLKNLPRPMTTVRDRELKDIRSVNMP